MRIAFLILFLSVGFALAGCSLQHDAMGYGPGSPLDGTAGHGGGDGTAGPGGADGPGAGDVGGTDSSGAPF